MKLSAVILSVILILAFLLPVSAETVGNLQKEEKRIIVDYGYSQKIELIDLRNRMVFKRDEIREFEARILPSIQWNIPPDIMTLNANGKLEGDFFLVSEGMNGEFNAEANTKSESLYRDFDPYVSEKTTKELLFFARNLLEEKGTYSSAEQVLQTQLIDLENKRINESGGMHIFYIQKIYNSIVDIGNELNGSVESINNKMRVEQENDHMRKSHTFIFVGIIAIIILGLVAYDMRNW